MQAVLAHAGKGVSSALALTPLLQRLWKANSTLEHTLSEWLRSDAGREWQKERDRIFHDPEKEERI